MTPGFTAFVKQMMEYVLMTHLGLFLNYMNEFILETYGFGS